MNQQEDKHLDDLTKKVIKEASLESPSLNFTDVLMSQINVIESSSTIVYKPLISKMGWTFISILFLGMILYMILGGNTESPDWLGSIDFSVFSNLKITNIFSGITIPKTVTYAVVLFGVMLSIQILFLKRHLNKPFED